MRALLDTNIVIHREMNKVFNQDIGILFKWLDKGKYEKCVHPITLEEIARNENKETVEVFKVKLKSYITLKTVAPLDQRVKQISSSIDKDSNDFNDTLLLNEVFCGRVDILITEDKKIHKKAGLLGILDSVFSIDSFLEKVVSENPDFINYDVLSVTKRYFGEIDLNDKFFDSFKEDYSGFKNWFSKKSDEGAYVTHNDGKILSFLYLKVEDQDENYSDIEPIFRPMKRLKIGTFKVVSNGVRLGERFLKIIFDNALLYKVEEIYVTLFHKRFEHQRLIDLLEKWGFKKHGNKISDSGEEIVLIRDFRPKFHMLNPKITFPYIPLNTNAFLAPIYPVYHTELLPDSYLRTESPADFTENQPHRNALSKTYISGSLERNIKRGDILIFYRTRTENQAAYYSALITTIAIVEEKIDKIADEKDFILKCKKRSIYTDDQLKERWNYGGSKPFIINFLYAYPFDLGKRMNRKRLLDLDIITGEQNELRGLKKISKNSFLKIIEEAVTNENIIIN